MNTLFTLDATKIDWEMLRRQKLWLMDLDPNLRTDLDPSLRIVVGIAGFDDQIEGILGFIDYVQDAAVDQGLVTEEAVFGFSAAAHDSNWASPSLGRTGTGKS